MTLLIYFLACLGAHRIWNFEEIFAPIRNWLLARHNASVEKRGKSWLKPIICQACNAFWIALFLGILLSVQSTRAVDIGVRALAAYTIVRAGLWSYGMSGLIATRLRIAAQPHNKNTAPPATEKQKPAEKQTTLIPQTEECTNCGDKKKAIIIAQERYKTFKKRVVLMTSLSSFERSYSLVSVIIDQARMLASNPDWLVQIWVLANANLADAPTDLPKNVEIKKIFPAVAWKSDTVDAGQRHILSKHLRLRLLELGNATIITHDLLFISSYLTAAAAINDIGDTKTFSWIHVCHSAAEKNPPLLTDNRRFRYTLPNGHYLLCLNPAEREPLAAHYHTTVDRVLVAPNARDITSFGRFDATAAKLVKKYQLDEADIVQVFPVSGTRLTAKGLPIVVDIFGRLAKNHGKTVRLVVTNAHSNGDNEKKALAELRARAIQAGMPSESLIVSSEEFPGTAAYGLSDAAIKDLLAVSNLFIFPSISELASLVILEAAISGCLMVTNKNLHTTPAEAVSSDDLNVPFESLRASNTADLDKVTASIVTRLDESLTNRTKRSVLRRYCYRSVAEDMRMVVEHALPV